MECSSVDDLVVVSSLYVLVNFRSDYEYDIEYKYDF